MNLPDTELKTLKDPGLMDFMDYTRIILNQGKYSFRVMNSPPVGSANDGDTVLYTDGSTVFRIYCYLGGGWYSLTFDNSTPEPDANLIIPNRTDDPAAPVVGQIWYRTDL